MVEQALHNAATKQELQRVMCLWPKNLIFIKFKRNRVCDWLEGIIGGGVQTRFANKGVLNQIAKMYEMVSI